MWVLAGVFHHAMVYLNGELLQVHTAGYTGFTVRLDNCTKLRYVGDDPPSILGHCVRPFPRELLRITGGLRCGHAMGCRAASPTCWRSGRTARSDPATGMRAAVKAPAIPPHVSHFPPRISISADLLGIVGVYIFRDLPGCPSSAAAGDPLHPRRSVRCPGSQALQIRDCLHRHRLR